MKKLRVEFLACCAVLLCGAGATASAAEFYAYYTKVRHSRTDYMGDYPDLIVVVGNLGQLEFTRRTNYLPLWRSDGIEVLVDDFFPERNDDYAFDHNYVRLIESTPDRILVHWRYMRNAKQLAEASRKLDSLLYEGISGVVHELFEIRPDGTVERVVRHKGDVRYRDWIHPAAATRQRLTLKADGVDHGPVTWGRDRQGDVEPVEGRRVVDTDGLPEPISHVSFDQGLDGDEEWEYDDAFPLWDEMSDSWSQLNAPMALYLKGVSGTAVAVEEYYGGVKWDHIEEVEGALTLEAWVALDRFPYNDAPIIHRSTGVGEQGYYLGVDAYGHPFIRVNGQTARSETPLPLYTWAHVAATAGGKTMKLYVNGAVAASAASPKDVSAPDVPVYFGRNNEPQRPTDCVRTDAENLLFTFGMQGVIDEMKIYDSALSAKDIAASYRAYRPDDLASPLPKAVLPGETGVAKSFGARYDSLEFHPLWDKLWRETRYADIVVKFDTNPGSVIFWRGTNYAANWITDENQWMADQSTEIFTAHGCSEHMADKQLRHCRARIIENNPARVVVHWRYPCVDVSYMCLDRRNWSDEYHTIYPDGTGIRKVIWNKGYDTPGFQDVQFLTSPGQTVDDIIHLQAATVANLAGETDVMTWKPPNHIPETSPLEGENIQLFNTKSKHKVFAIFPGEEGVWAWGEDEQSEYTDDPFAGPWNHWPVHLVPSDGRFAVATDRVTSFAIGGGESGPETGNMVFYGLTDQPIESLVAQARAGFGRPD